MANDTAPTKAEYEALLAEATRLRAAHLRGIAIGLEQAAHFADTSYGDAGLAAVFRSMKLPVVASIATSAPSVAEQGEAPVTVKTFEDGLRTAAKFVADRRDGYIEEHGSYDPETNATEFPGTGEEIVGEWDEIEEGILALILTSPLLAIKGDSNG